MPVTKPRHDLTGQTFGRLTVKRQAVTNSPTAEWLCACKCGTVKVVRGSALVAGQVKSCGCLRREFLESRKGASRALKLTAKNKGRAKTVGGMQVTNLRYQMVKVGSKEHLRLIGNVEGEREEIRWGIMGKTLMQIKRLDLDKSTV